MKLYFVFTSVFHCHFSEHVKGRDQIVMENLRDQGYKVYGIYELESIIGVEY